jgi:hypothetical protein
MKPFDPARRSAVLALLLATLSACGGGDVTETFQPSGPPSRIDGVLIGNVGRSSATYPALVLISGDRFMGYDLGGVFYDGRFTIAGGAVSANAVSLYAGNPFSRTFIRQLTETATMSASVTTAGWTGSIAAAGGPISFDLDYDLATDAQDSSLTFLEGNWLFQSGTYRSALTIAANGTTSTVNTDNGSSTLCDSTGAASVIDANFGIYGWQNTLSGGGCGNLDDLPYTGLAVLTDNAAPLGRLTVMLANANYFLRLTPFDRQAP